MSTTSPNGNGERSRNEQVPSSAQDSDGSGTRGRRLVLSAGAAAALGAVGVATAKPAQAASTALMTETTTNAAASTSLYATAAGSAFTVYQKGAGNGTFLVSDSTIGVTGRTLGENSWGGVMQNAGAALGNGGGLRVEGRMNVGVFADTTPGSDTVPALMGVGSDEVNGTALYTKGANVLDGDVYALRSFVGGFGAAGKLAYFPTASGQRANHDLRGKATLDSSGSASVKLPDTFLNAVDSGTILVVLTPVGAAMPNLHVASAPGSGSTSIQIGGGSAAGTVHYCVSAERIPVSIPSTSAGASTKLRTLAAQEDSAIRDRPELTLPRR